MPRGRPSSVWTEEQKQALRDWWTAERRLELALKRKASPQGSYSKEWWTAERRAAKSARMRRGELRVSDVEEAFAQADKVRRMWRDLGGW